MSARIPDQEFLLQWRLRATDIDFIYSKHKVARLGFAVQLKFFASHGFLVLPEIPYLP